MREKNAIHWNSFRMAEAGGSHTFLFFFEDFPYLFGEIFSSYSQRYMYSQNESRRYNR